MKNIQTVLNAILSKNVFEYMLIDKEFKLVHVSLGSMQFLDTIPEEGHSVMEYLPELVGYEEDLLKIFDTKGASMGLKTVKKGTYYFNIYVDHYDHEKVLVLLHNITETTKAQQEALQYSNRTLLLYDTLQKIINRQSTLIFVADNTNKIIFANQKFLDYFGIDTLEHLDEKKVALYKTFSQELDGYEVLCRALQPNGKHITMGKDTFKIEAAPIDAVHHLFTLTSVTELYDEKRVLEAEVEYDSLTGLMKKKYFDKRIGGLIEANRSFALVVTDIDNFKAVNDTYGHTVGDKVLQAFASLLEESLREGDMVARWGGEEFLFALSDADIKTVLSRVETIREKIASYPFETVGSLTASFGVAQNEEGDDIDILLHRADKALYEAKNSGRNKVVFKKKEKK